MTGPFPDCQDMSYGEDDSVRSKSGGPAVCPSCGLKLVAVSGGGSTCAYCEPPEKQSDSSTGECRCACGYTCDRRCGLPILECLKLHYVKDCDHKWDGPDFESENMSSATCSVCGMVAIYHDMRYGA